ncbi:uncharacterized protein JCM15063_002081 [Sporobolomyces koalae]|uniref:uncharacterized protein n=1 Tax=Sporobolomyces koalae TaxID=500713 RepID=UPI003176EEB4
MSGPARSKRLARELQECHKDTVVKVEQVDSKIDHFVGSFPGPTGTPYEGGWFNVDVQAPDRYPFEPLKMKFITKVYHPNVSSASGYICLDILKTSWSPVFTLRTCLVSLQSLLSTPEPNDPQDAEVAKHYLTDRAGFEETAKFWTEVYAAKPSVSSSSATSKTAPRSSGTTSKSSENGRDQEGQRTKRPRTRSQLSEGDGLRIDRFNRHAQNQTDEEDDDDDDIQVVEPGTTSSMSALEGFKKETKLSGLDWQDVETFSQMGFETAQVIDTLKRLNWRRGNKERCSEDQVVEKLIGN